MNLIWLLLQASWLNISMTIFAALVSGGASARLIALINSATNAHSTSKLLWDFLGTIPVAFFASVVSQILLAKLAQETIYILRLSLSRGILDSPLLHLEQLGGSRLMANLTGDVQILSSSFYLIPYFLVDIAVIIGCFTYLTWLSGLIVLITATILILAIVSIQLFLNNARKFLYLAREEEDLLFKHFRALTDGIKELKLNTQRRQEFLEQELQVSATVSRQHNIASSNIFALATSWGNLLFIGIVGFLVFCLPKIVPISASILFAYILTITYLINPFQNILQRLPIILRGSVALDKVEKISLSLASQKEDANIWGQQDKLSQNSKNSDLPTHTFISSPLPLSSKLNWTSLELEQVTYTYRGEQEDSRFTLGELNLSFHSGQLTFIVGGNGSGKSTLMKLITGLYFPEMGEIRLNGKTITDSNRQWYRQHFSAVFSDFYLFERIFGISNSDLDTQAKEYLQQLQLDHKVQVKNGILSTTALSQGQRKRLALLTAYLEDRPIYLFDEWASDQDPFFRDVFYNKLLLELKQRGKTVLAISHDDRYFHLADQVIKLDYGKVEYQRYN